MESVIDKVVEIIKRSPHSAESLLLFALLKTLDIEKGGHLYKLAKLKEMSPESRQLSYDLMESMAQNKTQDEDWQEKLQLIETIIRNNT